MRLPDWEGRLGELVGSSLYKPFEWGKFDCCTFAADAVVAVRGDDPLKYIRGSYGSLKSAWRLLSELGGLKVAVTKAMGPPMMHKALAQRGDIVLVESDKYPALAVVVGQAALAPLVTGVQRVPARDWIEAWRVD